MKSIPGFSKYSASIDGRVISNTTGLPVQRKYRKDGYINVLISPDIGPKYKLQLEHRLIAKAFYGDSKLEVNHKNGIKTDNRPSNLEFTTRSGNIRHSIDVLKNVHSKPGFDSPSSKISYQQHLQIKRWFDSKILDKKELSKFFDVTEATISEHIRKYKRIGKKYESSMSV